MSPQVRRIAITLATLTLLMSLFLLIQGFSDPPEALAGCQPADGCQSWRAFSTNACCCSAQNILMGQERWCWHVKVNCDILWYLEVSPYYTCTGGYCLCYPG